MEDLIKVATNGQWVLEKAKQMDPKLQQMIDEYMARKKQPAAPTRAQVAAAGLKPVERNLGANPGYSKEQVAAIRAGIAPDVVEAAGAGTKYEAPTAAERRAKDIAREAGNMARHQANAEEKGNEVKGHKAAWEAGVAFLAQHGSKGYQALQAQMQQKKAFDVAHQTGKLPVKPTQELLPPQKQGGFHNESATTAGKIVDRGHRFPTKEVDPEGKPLWGYTKNPQQEQHHWSWDHGNKKWKHLRTTYGNPTLK